MMVATENKTKEDEITLNQLRQDNKALRKVLDKQLKMME